VISILQNIDYFQVLDWFGWLTVFNVTFTNISLISLRSVLLVEETGYPKYAEKTTDQLQVTDKLENSAVGTVPQSKRSRRKRQK
jgi:hypothetical protein